MQERTATGTYRYAVCRFVLSSTALRGARCADGRAAGLVLLCLDSRPGSISLSALCLEPRVHDESSTSLRRCAYLELPKESRFARSMLAVLYKYR